VIEGIDMNGLLMPIGTLLLAIGLIMSLSSGFSYVTREKVVDLGAVEVTAEKEKTIPFSPVIGGTMIIAGSLLLVTGLKTRRQ
jgi:hypothetical protein